MPDALSMNASLDSTSGAVVPAAMAAACASLVRWT
jgi:hypothetical protein